MDAYKCAISAIVTTVLCTVASPAAAQNYDLDARNVGMGAIGSTRNIAVQFITEREKYHRIGLPFGLFQVLANKDVFFYKSNDPNRKFDVFRSLEYARNPFDFTFNRNASNTGKKIVDDIIDSGLNRDLNVYRPFHPAPEYVVEGVGFPNWGVTFKFAQSESAKSSKDKKKRDADGYQGIYVGAGPYLTATTDTHVDQQLIDVLGASTPTYIPNASMAITHATDGQIAAAIIGGYRLYVPHHGKGTRPEGVYFAINAAYLIGFRWFDLSSNIHFDTDAAGLLTVRPATVPIDLNTFTSTSGRGRVIDAGLWVTLEHWDFGLGINGIANQITWKNAEHHRYVLPSFFTGADMSEVVTPPVVGDMVVKVPLNTSTNLGYTASHFSWAAEYSRRFNGNNIQLGTEVKTKRVAFRVGLRYARDRWHPAGGIGFNLGSRVGLDVAILSTSTNVERRRTAALVFSIRIESKKKDDDTKKPAKPQSGKDAGSAQ